MDLVNYWTIIYLTRNTLAVFKGEMYFVKVSETDIDQAQHCDSQHKARWVERP